MPKKESVHKHDIQSSKQCNFEEVSAKQKAEVLKRDDYRCVICGHGKKEGVELHVVPIQPKDQGGKTSIDNSQTLCSQHNFFMKNFKQTESWKGMFIKLQKLGKKHNDKKLQDFSKDVLKTYKKHGINEHIKWNK